MVSLAHCPTHSEEGSEKVTATKAKERNVMKKGATKYY